MSFAVLSSSGLRSRGRIWRNHSSSSSLCFRFCPPTLATARWPRPFAGVRFAGVRFATLCIPQAPFVCCQQRVLHPPTQWRHRRGFPFAPTTVAEQRFFAQGIPACGAHQHIFLAPQTSRDSRPHRASAASKISEVRVAQRAGGNRVVRVKSFAHASGSFIRYSLRVQRAQDLHRVRKDQVRPVQKFCPRGYAFIRHDLCVQSVQGLCCARGG